MSGDLKLLQVHLIISTGHDAILAIVATAYLPLVIMHPCDTYFAMAKRCMQYMLMY